jgi:hypothetical protein
VPGNEGRPRAPFVGAEATAWWHQAAAVGDIVRELHFNARITYERGALLGSRARRISMRRAIAALRAIGIPPERIGLQVGFQSGSGKGGREGLAPREAWLTAVKREVLAARQVAADEGIATVWTWGWGTFGPGSEDPDKESAACVYLWTRDPALCDGPGAAGPGFDASLADGQIILPAGVHCSLDVGSIGTTELEELTAAVGDRQTALDLLLARLALQAEVGTGDEADVEHALTGVVDRAFGGSVEAYQAHLAELGTSEAAARALVADGLRRQAAQVRLFLEGSSDSLELWTTRLARSAVRTATCLRDELPAPTGADGLAGLEFLRLLEPATTVTAAAPTTVYGSPVELTGTVTSDRATESVTVLARLPDGSRTEVTTVPVGADGSWSAEVTPELSTRYRAVSRSAASTPALVRVAPLVTLRVEQNRLVAEVAPGRPGAKVVLQRRTGSGWTPAATARLGASSRVRFRWKPKPGDYTLRAVISRGQAGQGLLAGASAELAYVRDP